MSYILELAEQFRAALQRLDVDAWSGEECAALVQALTRTRKASEAAEARAARRVSATGAYRVRGFPAATDWLAVISGDSFRDVKLQLSTSAAIEDFPETRAAVDAGDITLAQADEIVRTEEQVPGSEAELLDTARSSTLGALRHRARRRRMSALGPEGLAAAQNAARSLFHWEGELGMLRGSFALPPTFGLAFASRLDTETDRRWREARRRGEQCSREQCAADAFMTMMEGAGAGQPSRADVVFVCDVNAAARGHSHEGEVCRIVGGSSVPVSTVMEAARAAFIKAVLHDGEKVRHVVHYGRRPNALQRTVLMLGLPPEFDGARCSEPGCGRRFRIEFHHRDPYAVGGVTSLDDLEPLCREHHDERTERDRRAGTLGSRARRDGCVPSPASPDDAGERSPPR